MKIALSLVVAVFLCTALKTHANQEILGKWNHRAMVIDVCKLLCLPGRTCPCPWSGGQQKLDQITIDEHSQFTLLKGSTEWKLIREGDFQLTSQSGPDEIDFTYNSITLVPLNENRVQKWNSLKLCGISDWSAGVARDVGGRMCYKTQFPPVGSKLYDIVQTREGELFFGDKNGAYNGTTPALRPRTLAPEAWFKSSFDFTESFE